MIKNFGGMGVKNAKFQIRASCMKHEVSLANSLALMWTISPQGHFHKNCWVCEYVLSSDMF